jgi:hypothetical protein
MAMEREAVRKFWGWETTEGPYKIQKETLFSDGLYHIYKKERFWNRADKYHHYVIDTDYDNYALVFGCDRLFFFWHYTWVSLLYRSDYAEQKHVAKSKEKLDEIGYDYVNYWVKSGTTCGFDAAPTYDEIMISVFDRAPYWNDYLAGSTNTKRMKMLYVRATTVLSLPWGAITGPIHFNRKDISTPIKEQILESDAKEFVFITHVLYDSPEEEVGNRTLVDIWLLIEDLSQWDINILHEFMEAGSASDPVCCYNEVDGADFVVSQYITGFARIVVHNEERGIDSFMEGRFDKGR